MPFYWHVLRSKQNLKKLFYSLEIFLQCGEFSTVWRLLFQPAVWILLLQSTMWGLFYDVETLTEVYSVETFLDCSLRCQDFSTVWRLSVQRASYGLWTRFAVGEHDRMVVFYLFGHRTMYWVINQGFSLCP